MEKDPEAAFSWFTRAATQGVPEAQYQLGKAYQGGIGTKADPTQAYQWLTLASRKFDDVKPELEEVRKSLQPDQREAADSLIRLYKPVAEDRTF